MWKLVIEDDEGKRTIVPLTRDEYPIGRREGNVIRLTERNVSRDHARVRRAGGDAERAKYSIEDLTSYNGVFVNGLRVSHAHDLAHGDLIQIGDYRIVLQDESAVETTEPGPADWKQTVPNAPPLRGSGLLDRPNRLVMLAGPTPGAEYPLDRERMTIGRAEDANVSVNHNSVSRLHCEVHALGDGRFEIVDKGSSNGVRVNGSDLRRGIVEPGDLIELGDVRFKFIGAGQVFRAAEPLSVIGDREPGSEPGRGRRALPVAVFVVVVVAGAAGAWISTRPKMRASAPTTSAYEETVLADAKSLCAAGDCDGAQAKLDATFPEGSRWRDTQEFREVESRWAESVMQRADAATDAATKRELYQRVAQTMAVDPGHRKAAADRIQQLDANAANPLELPVAPSVAAAASKVHDEKAHEEKAHDETAAATTHGESSRKPSSDKGDKGETAAASPPSNAAAPAGGNIEEHERQLALAGTPDAKMALKQQLETRVYSGKASESEIRLLISTCKDLGDKSCVQQARGVLAQKAP